MPDCCKLGHISEKRVKYYDDAKRYSIAFADVKISDERTIEEGIIYFDESLVRKVDDHFYEVDLCQDTYPMRVSYNTIEVSRQALIQSRLRYFHNSHYVFSVSPKVVKESSLAGTKNVLFDLPIKFWDVAESKNCSVTVNVEKLIVQNYQNRTIMIFGRKENDVKIKFWYQLKDGSWKDETVSAGRFWYLVKESKEKKKELGLY